MIVGMRTARTQKVKNNKDAVEVIYWCTLHKDRD